ncbi:ephexin-1 isoform X1 [Haemorhous mexicanus]|uniref:ephexin-1 isoform X1 n=2 Tax=Haemorhous mexicanus TaxID=30427 RepID=UPI0028BE1BEA|nr:ephexin-1 isoform X1 [Haemorhous mexicanus]XP_059711184.1 ephexin-1 isoform X1 [Haemorhous mexicanus]
MEEHGREATHRLSTGGLWQGHSQHILRESGSVSEGEEESAGANPVMHEGDLNTQYIAIQRNSRYYRSMRMPNRGKRKTSREAMHMQHATGSLKNYEPIKEPLNVLPHKGSPSPANSDPTTLDELLIQRLLPSYPRYRGNRPGSPSPAPLPPLPPELLGSRLPPPAMELLAAALSAACAFDQDGSPGQLSRAPPAAEETPAAGTAAPAHPMTADSWRNLIEHIGLLYQEYRDKSTREEIETRRLQDSQTDPEETSPSEEAPSEAEPTSTSENKAPPQINLLRNSNSRFNLWQDLPEVQNSGVLSILQPDEIKLQEAMFELVTSEASYYKSLNLLVSHFMENERLKKILHQSEAHILFSNVLDVMAVSERFLLDLEQRVEENIVISDVCDIVYQHTVNHFSVYITYVSNQTYQERTYKQLLQDKPAFREVISQLELDPKCKGLSFSSFLILPFQRITRLKLLVQNILKKVEEKSDRESTALDAHKELETVVKACNEGVRKMSRTEQMISIQKKLEFKIKSVPIISHSRWLLKQGELQQMNGPKTSRTLRTKKLFREIYLFLFNDLLVICRQIPGDKYQVFDSAPRGLLRVEELEDQGQSLANVFILRLLENADDREASYMLKASSQSEMKRWMISLAPNRRTKFVSFTSRLVDCPQIQCVHPYVAQQPDELSLELADVLNILDKTDDGWIFGERLHDQERGWFPSSMGEEILNPKIRAQNLKECFRVHKSDDSQRRKLGSRNRQ